MTRCAAIITTMLATAAVCACADRPHEQTERQLPEEAAMGNDSAVETSIVDLERAALEQYGRGDVEGPLALCDQAVSYFDPFVERRIDDRTTLAAHLKEARGKARYDHCELMNPRVQAFGDTAILTCVLGTADSSDPHSEPTRWKVTTVYHRSDDRWRVVHSHFALFADSSPRDFEFTTPPADLGRLEGALLGELLSLEDAAMERWRRGDPWGFWELSAPRVSYFDPETDGRVDGTDGLRRLYAAVEGKIHYGVSEYIAPRVQAFGDVAVLSYHYRSADVREDGSVSSGTRWNTTEVFARVDDRWRIVHTHWSYARAGSAELAPSS
jgi:ketosteroid isomerase-like protein